MGEEIEFINGKAFKQIELLNSGKYRVLRVGNFNTNNKWYFSDLKLPDKQYVNKGDLLYTWATTFEPHIWNEEKVIFHYHIWKLVLSSKLNKFFIYHLLIADSEKLTNNTNGSTMIHVTKSEMESKQVNIPKSEEQKKIAILLGNIDKTIASNQRQYKIACNKGSPNFVQKYN